MWTKIIYFLHVWKKTNNITWTIHAAPKRTRIQQARKFSNGQHNSKLTPTPQGKHTHTHTNPHAASIIHILVKSKHKTYIKERLICVNRLRTVSSKKWQSPLWVIISTVKSRDETERKTTFCHFCYLCLTTVSNMRWKISQFLFLCFIAPKSWKGPQNSQNHEFSPIFVMNS